MSLLHADESRPHPGKFDCGGRLVAKEGKRDVASPQPPQPAPGRVVASEDLFHGEKEIWIEHGGVRYRLRITRRNKLILQK